MTIKIEAASRLKAVRLIPVEEAYSEAHGQEDLLFEDKLKRKCPELLTPIGTKDRYTFFQRTTVTKMEKVLCAYNGKFIGILTLTPINIGILKAKNAEPTEWSVMQPSSFLLPKFRGEGLMLGMYEYALTRHNLLSDRRQSPMSHALWKRLAATHVLRTLKIYDQMSAELIEAPRSKLDSPNTYLLLQRK